MFEKNEKNIARYDQNSEDGDGLAVYTRVVN